MTESGHLRTDRGSFRDRHGRVYRDGDRIFRGLSRQALDNYLALEKKAFFVGKKAEGKIVESRLLAVDELPPDLVDTGAWAGFLEHQRIPFISYPYEWSFGMLRDAALLHLELLEAAILEGMVIKDSTPYNIQFSSAKPVFIDIPSFEPLPTGSVWGGYKQFCEMFLFPLMLKAYRGLEFQPLMRSRIDGVDIASAASIFAKTDWLRKGVFSHVWLQSLMHDRHLQSDTNVRTELKAAGFNEQMILANVRKLRKLVERLEWKNAETEWGDYEDFHNYSQRDVEAKEQFVESCLSKVRPSTTWDIGCNTGRFSRLAEKYSGRVIAMDIDHLAVERLYQTEKNRDESRINPILQNIADPSPNWGWRNRERTDLLGRSQPDFVMCLALIHHIVISANIPLGEFVQWLAEVTPNLVLEFVSRDDDKVRTLLLNKEDIYTDYGKEELERRLEEHFRIEDRLQLESGNRYLYFCARN